MDFVRSGEKEVKECKDVRCEGVHNLGMAKGKVNICTGRRDIVGGNGENIVRGVWEKGKGRILSVDFSLEEIYIE